MTEPLLLLRVAAKRREADDISSFELVAQAVIRFLPSPPARTWTCMYRGMAGQYSLCNSPAERHRYVIGVLRKAAGRGGSAALHDRVNVGDPLG